MQKINRNKKTGRRENVKTRQSAPFLTNHVWVGTDRGVSVYHKADNRWTKLDREDGLLSDDVTAIATDGKSVWIGTTLGVSLYELESKRWKKFQRRDGLASNEVTAIAVDGNYIWVGTDTGISRYDKTTGAWALQREKDKDQFNAITAIAVESEYVWFGTEDGLRRYDKPKDAWNAYTKEEGLVENHIRHIALSPDAVWVGTEKSGVSKYSTINQTFTESHTRTDRIESDFIRAIAVDGDNVWFGSADRGLRRYITTVDTWFKYTTAQGLVSDHITVLTVDGRDIWLGTYEHGLGRYDKSTDGWTWYSRRDTLVSNQIKSLVSTEGALWAGTNKGLSRYSLREKTWRTYTKADGLATNYITALANNAKDGTLWVGTPLGLGRLEGERWRFYTQRNGLANNFVTCISLSNQVPTRRGSSTLFGSFRSNNVGVWVGTKGGLSVLMGESPPSSPQSGEDKQTRSIRESTRITANQISVDSRGLADGFHVSRQPYLTGKWVTAVLAIDEEVWAGTTEGLYRKNAATDKFEPFPVVTDYVNTLVFNPDGRLLVGTRNGLWIIRPPFYPPASGGIRGVTHITDGLPNLNVRAIALDGETIWVGTPGGVARSDGIGVQQVFTMQPDGLLHDNIQSIAVVDKQVFFGTVAGLAVYEVEKDRWEKHTPYHDTEILREDQVRWIELDGHHLWALNWSASPNGAILKFDRRTNTWIEYTKDALPLSPEVPFITAISRLAVGKEDVWCATGDGGVLRYNKASDTWTHFTRSSGLPGHHATLIEFDGSNGVWVAFLGGVAAHYDTWAEKWETVKVTEAGVGTYIEDIACTKDYVWFSTRSVGVKRYERATKTWRSYTEAQGMASRSGDWIATDGEGVWTSGRGHYSWVRDRRAHGVSYYRPDDDTWTIYDRREGLRADRTDYGQVGEDYVWCFGGSGINRYDKTGTSRGLSRYDKEKETWTSFTKPTTLADRRAVAVATDSRYVWVGTHRGLSRYDKHYDRWKHFQKSEEERDEEDNEDEEDEEDGEKEEKNELVDNNVIDLSVGRRYVWIATEGGVGRYDKIADRFESYTKENQLPSVDIRAVVQNRSDVWIGTKNGISKHSILSDDRNAWETYNAAIEILPTVEGKYAKSLKNDDVRCLAVDENRVWAGTKTGVSLYALRQGTWTTFTQNDGLASDEVSCIIVDNEQVWSEVGAAVTVYDTLNETWKVLTEADGLRLKSEYINGNPRRSGSVEDDFTNLNETFSQIRKEDSVRQDEFDFDRVFGAASTAS
ncbi:Histidine kinase P4 [Geodia barretti]|uniref:Histidine kinase P4 n=1 Tax=Geodia barretti TaxID=519541 RepID=A0AA35S9I5_GEOBA|nr:Histidine kinase P4 [Geodia barretti]